MDLQRIQLQHPKLFADSLVYKQSLDHSQEYLFNSFSCSLWQTPCSLSLQSFFLSFLSDSQPLSFIYFISVYLPSDESSPTIQEMAYCFLTSSLRMFRMARKMLFIPWSRVVRQESFPLRTAKDSVEPVPVYCLERASPLSAQRLRQRLEKGEFVDIKANPFLNSLISIQRQLRISISLRAAMRLWAMLVRSMQLKQLVRMSPLWELSTSILFSTLSTLSAVKLQQLMASVRFFSRKVFILEQSLLLQAACTSKQAQRTSQFSSSLALFYLANLRTKYSQFYTSFFSSLEEASRFMRNISVKLALFCTSEMCFLKARKLSSMLPSNLTVLNPQLDLISLQKRGTVPRLCRKEKQWSFMIRTCSVSTQLPALPSLSMPRAQLWVPPRLTALRLIRMMLSLSPLMCSQSLPTKPWMTEIRHMGSKGWSCAWRWEAQLKQRLSCPSAVASFILSARSQEKEKYMPCSKMVVMFNNISASFSVSVFFSCGSQNRQISFVILKMSRCPMFPTMMTSSARMMILLPLRSKMPIKQLKKCGFADLYSYSLRSKCSRMTLDLRLIYRTDGMRLRLRLGTMMKRSLETQTVIACRLSSLEDLWYSNRLGSSSIKIIFDYQLLQRCQSFMMCIYIDLVLLIVHPILLIVIVIFGHLLLARLLFQRSLTYFLFRRLFIFN